MLYFTSILLTGVLAGFLAWYAWRQRNLPGLRAYAGLALCICLLALSESLSMLSSSPAQALFWFNVRIIFTATIPVLFLVFALEYNGHKDWLSRRLLVFAFIFPVLTQVILWSNSLHGLWVKQEVAFHRSGSFWLVETSTRIPGLWFMVHSFYCLILLLAGIVVILVTAWNRRGLYRAQGLLLAAGALIALVVTLIPVFNLLPQAEFNPFTPGLGLSFLLTALAVFGFRSLKRLPAAPARSRIRTLEAQSGRSQAVFFLIFFVLAAGLATVGYLSYQNYKRQFRQRAEDQLSAIANLKVSELQDWRAERMGDAQVLQTPAFAALAARCLENPPDTQVQVQMQAWLDSLRKLYNYDRVFLMDTTGLERISSPAVPEPVAAHLTQEEAAVLSAGQVTFLDFHRDTEDGPIYLTLLVPISAEQNNYPLGLVVLRIDPNVYLYPYIQQWPVPSASSETLLVRRQGTDVLFLNELRFRTDAALTLRAPLENIQSPAVKSARGQEGIVEGVDYRGVPVLAAVHAVPDSPWFLEAKTDTAEVYAPLRERLWETLVFFGALLAATGGGLMLVWRQQRVRYYRGQVEAAQALRASEEKFKLAFLISPDVVTITRLVDDRFVSVNQAFTQILGYTEAEVVGKTSMELGIWVNPGNRDKIVAGLQAQDHVVNFEALFRARQGDIRDGLISASVIELDGEPHLLLTTKDVTERNWAEAKILAAQAESQQLLAEADQSRRTLLSILEDQQRAGSALRDSEEKLSSVIKHTGVGIVVIQNGERVFYNAKMYEMLEYTKEEYAGLDFISLVHPKDRSFAVDLFQQGPAGAESNLTQIRLLAKSGQIRWIETSSTRIQWEGQPAIQAFVLDITERKRAESILQARVRLIVFSTSNPLGELMQNTLDEISALTDSTIGFFHFVEADERTISKQTWSTRTLVEMCTAEGRGRHYDIDEAGVWVDCVRQRRPVVHNDYASLPHRKGMPAGHALVIREMVFPIIRNQKIVAIIGVGNKPQDYTEDDVAYASQLADLAWDIVERKRVEEALQVYTAKLEQSNRDLQEFAYVASHDLQEPLRKVLAFGDLLTNKYGDALGETGRDYLKRMWDASQRMQTLIYDLLSFSRVSTRTQPFTEVDLNTVAQEVLSDLQNRIEHTSARVETGHLPTIQADPTQMRQLLQNLIGNALKFHSKENQPLIKVSAQIQDKECQISVQDNGIGFDIQYLDRIFKPFERLHSRQEYDGSGMGLAICRRIIERHGGSITATSTPGEGSVFIVTLPIHQS